MQEHRSVYLFVIMVSIISCFWLDGCSMQNNDSNYYQDYYQYKHREYIDMSDDKTKTYTNLSEGCIINGVDVFELSCRLIQNTACKSYEQCDEKESMTEEVYNKMHKVILQETEQCHYVSGSFKYKIRSIINNGDRLVVDFVTTHDYEIDGNINKGSIGDVPDYLCMKYDGNRWLIEYYDNYKRQG